MVTNPMTTAPGRISATLPTDVITPRGSRHCRPTNTPASKRPAFTNPRATSTATAQIFSERDLAETPLASEDSHLLDRIEPECDQPGYQAQHMDAEQVWDVVRRLLGELVVQKNARLALECLALASGLAFLGDSMTEIARGHGLTRAAVSKRCVELARKIGLPPSRAMRSLTARVAYAHARRKTLRRREH